MSRPTKKEVMDALSVLKSALKNEMIYDKSGIRVYSFYKIDEYLVPDPETLAKISYLDAEIDDLRKAIIKIEARKAKVMSGKTILETLGLGNDDG